MDPKEFDEVASTPDADKEIISSELDFVDDIAFEQWKMGVIENEVREYKKILGKKITVDPIPPEITPEVVEKLKFYGMELNYIPRLNLGTFADLKNKGIKQFLQDLKNRYPKWQIPRGDYWDDVRIEATSFPHSGGYWVGVETLDKPEHGSWPNRVDYKKTEMTKALGVFSRFWAGEDNFGNWDELNYILKKEKGKILSHIGLPNGELRLLEVLEWNLLALRYGWGKTDTSEYVNSATEAGSPPLASSFKYDSYCCCGTPYVMGNSLHGGAKCVLWYPSWEAQRALERMETDTIGWRVVVDIGKNIEATELSQADYIEKSIELSELLRKKLEKDKSVVK